MIYSVHILPRTSGWAEPEPSPHSLEAGRTAGEVGDEARGNHDVEISVSSTLRPQPVDDVSVDSDGERIG